MKPVFLTAEWRKLAIANYIVDPVILQPFLPPGTEIDFWKGRCYASLVGFLFLNTRIKGIQIPYHTNFEEVNLRFYVRVKEGDGWKRGVVFISEFVPLRMVTFIANQVYRERYRTLAMSHNQVITHDHIEVEYSWKTGRWNRFSVNASAEPHPMSVNSEEEFITEHYWGYSKKVGYTSAYEVSHPRWEYYPLKDYSIDVDFEKCYGQAFAWMNTATPLSVFLMEGSNIKIHAGDRLKSINDKRG